MALCATNGYNSPTSTPITVVNTVHTVVNDIAKVTAVATMPPREPDPIYFNQLIQIALAETVAISEALTRIKIVNRGLTSTITISESPAKYRLKTRTLSQTVTISEALARVKIATRALSNTIGISEAVAKFRLKTRTLAQTVTISELVDTTKISIRALTNTIAISEAVAKFRLKTRTLAQTVTISESLARTAIKTRTKSETVSISEAVAKFRLKTRTLAQTVTISESLARQAIKTRTLAQTVTISEAVAKFRLKTRTLAETIGISEVLSRQAIKTRTKSETVSISEAPAKFRLKTRTLSQTVSISEALARVAIKTRALSQTVAISESLAKYRLKTRTLAETVSISESAARQAIKTRAISQSIAISEAIAKYRLKTRTLSQTVTISEALTRTAIKSRAISQSVAISESLARVKKVFRNIGTPTSILFNGTTDGITIGNNSAIDNLDDFSISMWIFPTSTNATSTPHLMIKLYPSNNGYILYFTSNTYTLNFRTVNNSGTGVSATSNYIQITGTSLWYHVLATFKRSTGAMNLYINGVLRDTKTNTGLLASGVGGTSSMSINGAGGGIKWGGNVRDYRVYNAELTQTDATNLANGLEPSTQPIYRLPMQEGSGTPSDSINNYRTTFLGTPTWDVIQPAVLNEGARISETLAKLKNLFRKLVGYTKNSVNFDGVNDWINGNVQSNLWSGTALDNFSFSMWINPSLIADGNYREIVQRGWGAAYGFDLYYYNTLNRLYFEMASNPWPNRIQSIYNPLPITYGQWYHIVVTYDKNASSHRSVIYVDGSSASTLWPIDNVGETLNNTSALTIATSGGLDFKGYMRDFRWWNRTLTSSEAFSLSKGGGPWDMDAWIPMDEGTGNPKEVVKGITITNNGTTWVSELPDILLEKINVVDTLSRLKAAIKQFGYNPQYVMSFDGSNDGLNLGNPAVLDNLTDGFTWTMWVRPTLAGSPYRGIISQNYPNPGGYTIWYGGATPSLQYVEFKYNIAGTSYFHVFADGRAVDKWYFLCISWDNTTKKSYLVCGTQSSLSSARPATQTMGGGANMILAGEAGGSASDFGGYMADVRFFRRPLTDAEVASIKAGVWIAEPDLWIPFQEGSGTPHDVKGDIAISLLSTPTYSTSFYPPAPETISLTDSFARIKKSVKALTQSIGISESLARIKTAIRNIGSYQSIIFDGTDDTMDLGNVSSLWSQALTKFSFSFWFNPDIYDATNNRWIVSHGGFAAQAFYVYCDGPGSANRIVFTIRNAANSPQSAFYSGIIFPGNWYHIACTYDNSLGSENLKIYVNGALSVRGALTETINKSASLIISPAIDATNKVMDGRIKDFRWWTTKALTQTEVNNIKANNSSAPTPDYWLRMDEGIGNPVDKISNSKVGTLQNGATWDQSQPTIFNEGATIIDSLARTGIKSRSISETVGISEVLSRGKTVFRALAQTIGISEVLSRVKISNRSISQSVSISEVLSRTATKFRSITSTVSISESVAKYRLKTRTINQTVAISEVLSRVKISIRALSQSIAISENLAKYRLKTRALSQTVVIAEALAKIKNLFRAFGQFLYDEFTSTYDLTTDDTTSPNGKWRMKYHGANPQNPSGDLGRTGVRVPSGGAFPNVLYEYPYSSVNTGSGTSSSLVLTESTYYSDFDITFWARTKAQKKSSPNAWEAFWLMFRYNESDGERFHHYYIILKSNGHIEFGKKDNTVQVDEQYYLLAAEPAFSFTLGVWNKIRLRAIGNHFTCWIDDVQKFDTYDDGSLGSQSWAPNTPLLPSIAMYSGKLGIYNEDAEIEVSPIQLTILDSSAVSDTITRIAGKKKTFSSSISLSDSLARKVAAMRTFSQTVVISDTFTRLKNTFRTFSNTTSVSDSLSRFRSKFRTLADYIIDYLVPTGGDTTVSLASTSNLRYGIELNGAGGALVNKTVGGFAFSLKKQSSPSGDITATVRRSSDDAIVAQAYNYLDSTLLTTSFQYYRFTLPTPYTLQNGDKILIEYGGANGVVTELYTTDQFDGSLTRRI